MRVRVVALSPTLITVTRLLADLLRERVRRAPGTPLLTYYDLSSGERTELSATTFANWVDKTSNLLVDELMIDAGDRVELALAALAPGHWVSAIWQLACWQVGASVTLGRASGAQVVVCGPDWRSYVATHGPELLACALHPLGLGFPERLPAGVTDYALEVRGQPDHFAGASRVDSELAWLDSDRELTQADLVAGPVEGPLRRLARPTDPWTTARDGIITALVTGGSVVLVVGDDDSAIARLRTTERVD
jgi:uncharacterized protein (TIGR03089 family)